MGAHVDGGSHDAGRGRHAWRYGRGEGPVGRVYAAVVRASPPPMLLFFFCELPSRRSTRSCRRTCVPQPTRCERRFRPCRRGRRICTRTHRSRQGSMPCSVPRGSTHGPAGVCSLPPLAHPSPLTSFFSLDDHFFDALTARTCNGHPLPCSDASSLCVSEADAASVFALGDFEYECVCSSRASPSSFPPMPHALHCAATYGTRPKTHRRTLRSHSVRPPLLSLSFSGGAGT